MSAGAPREVAGPCFAVGDEIGRYRLVRRIGRGGMGEVFAARDPTLDREVAIKVVRGDRWNDDAELTLREEARKLAELSHPNIVQVYDVATVGSSVCVAMELVEGGSLSARLRGAARPWEERLGLYLQAGRGLAAAHAAGLVHRDFKPGNVLVTADGRALVTDFGLARYARPASDGSGSMASSQGRASRSSGDSVDPTSEVAGTPPYMAPEQQAGGDVDARADQFSFAVALHIALHGRHPFFASSAEAMLARIHAGHIDTTPRQATWPRQIDRVLQRARLRVCKADFRR